MPHTVHGPISALNACTWGHACTATEAHLARVTRRRHQLILQEAFACRDEVEDPRLWAAQLGALEALLAQLDHGARLVGEHDVLG